VYIPTQLHLYGGGGVTSFGEDADKNALLLAPDGVYVVVAPSLCGTPDRHDNNNNTAVAIRNWVIGVAGWQQAW
jgi:hypothetical protein